MPFPSALSSGRQAQLRQLDSNFQQYLLLTPNTVVWQTQPLAQVSGAIPYAEFDWDGTDQGNRADVQVGMTVLISTSTDYRATTIFRGRVRVAPDGTAFYLNETSVNLETTYYVTVLDDYDIHERLERRLVDGTRFIDYDIIFDKLPPSITGLQSSYVSTDGGVISIALNPDVTAEEVGASVTTYLWDVADGTLTSGTTADKDIVVEFDPANATHRWVRITATDDNNVSQYFTFEVFTVDVSQASPNHVQLGTDSVSISATQNEGFNATVAIWDGYEEILDKTRCTIASIDNYNDVKELPFTSGGTYEVLIGDTITGDVSGAVAIVVAIDINSGTWAGGNAEGVLWVNEQTGIFEIENLDVDANLNVASVTVDSEFNYVTQNVTFVGRLQQESLITRGDETFGQVQTGTLNIQGFLAQLNSEIKGPGLMLSNSANSFEWGQVTTLTVGRALYYGMTYYTTLLNVSSVTLPSDIADYDWGEYVIPPSAMGQWINDLADDINARLVFDASGGATIQRQASIAGTAGLTDVLTFHINDGGESDLEEWGYNRIYTDSTATAIIGAGTFNTTTSEVAVYRGQAPSQNYGPGWEQGLLNQQIMKSDLTETQAQAETGARISAYLASINPKGQINVTLPAGYYWLVPADHLLYSFNVADTENIRGLNFDSNTKWVCVSVDYGYNPELPAYQVNATFEEVTVGANYGITVTQIININDLTLPDLPPIGAGLGAVDPLVNFPLEDPDFDLPGGGSGGIQPGDPENMPAVGCDQFNVNMRSGNNVLTKNVTQVGETYYIQVSGDGVVGTATQTNNYFGGNGDLTSPYTLTKTDKIPSGSCTPVYDAINDRIEGCTSAVATAVGFNLLKLYPSLVMTSVSFTTTWNQTRTGGTFAQELIFDGVVVASQTVPNSITSGTSIVSWTGSQAVDAFEIDCGVRNNSDGDGSYSRLIALAITFTTTGLNERGDAFYYGYQDGGAGIAYPPGRGLLLNGSAPTTEPYNSGHIYNFSKAGTGSKLTFRYDDTTYTDNENAKLLVTVCGAGMALTEL